jgi:hypothetical protein
MRRILLALAAIGGLKLAAAGDRPIDFNRDVRPILSDKCYSCHGPDSFAKKIPLRLDQEAAAKADLGGRHAIVPGDTSASEVVRRITAEQPARRMPPPYSGLKLNENEINTLRSWIAQGAHWQKHWSLNAPVRPPVPVVKDQAWARNPIDAFVLERLEREGLKPSPLASKETLIRRVSLDLTGIPPDPAEIDAFLNDASPNAYERVVDRLLASPRYGERMSVPWLNAARYADSNGYQYDGERVMWRWRDWVIQAFNRNQPFDRFALEQIAGDMLPDAALDQKLATGFNRNHRANTEDGIIPEEYAVEYVVDRVETTSTVFLGLTLGCARCHNHKYDPFTQKEFYQLFAYFNNVPELGRAMKYGNSPPLISAPTAAQQQMLDGVDSKIAKVRKFLESRKGEIEGGRRTWEKSLQGAPPLYWKPVGGLDAAFTFDTPGEAKAVGGTPASAAGLFGNAVSFDGSVHLESENAGKFDIDDRLTLSAWIYSDEIPDGPIATRMGDSPRGRGFGLHANKGRVHVHFTSNYDDDAIRVETEETLQPKRWYALTMTYSGSRMAEGVKVYIDGKPAATKVLLDTLYRPFRNAGRQSREPFRIGGGWGPERRFHGLIDDVRVYNRILGTEEIGALASKASLNQMAAGERGAGTYALRSWYLENQASPEVRDAWSRLTALQTERETMERSFPTAMVMAESPAPKETFLLLRGAYDKHGEKVQPGVPEVLPPLPANAPNNRLGFAQWLIDPANPLTARVAVNRFWQMYFGGGLVGTPEDFGVQGDSPSHPELLDWLATEFVRTGWDVKAMQKLIVMSATYRQSSRTSQELAQKDPENRLLARGPRHRLPAEMVRDQALAAAGLLVERVGGPSVKPYQPDGLWNELAMQDMDYNRSKGPDLYRRGIYTFWKRTIPPPMMVNFDAANREACVVRDSRTNTPLQALNLMNDVTFLEAARKIGERMLKEGGASDEERLRYGFRLITSRYPADAEAAVLRDNLRFHRDIFSDAPKADGYLKQGDSPVDSSWNARELASYAAVASLILNLDETVTKE